MPYEYKDIMKSCSIKLIRYKTIEKLFEAALGDETAKSHQSNNTKINSQSNNVEIADQTEPERRYPKRNRVQRYDISVAARSFDDEKKGKVKIRRKNEESLKKMDFWYSWYNVS